MRKSCDAGEGLFRREIKKLAQGRLLGGFFASSRARLREVAQRLGFRHVANQSRCPAR